MTKKKKGDVDLRNKGLQSVVGLAPRFVNGDFIVSHNPLETLKGFPQRVNGDVYVTNTDREFTEEEIRSVSQVKGNVYVGDSPSHDQELGPKNHREREYNRLSF